jgi:hypothetical protein
VLCLLLLILAPALSGCGGPRLTIINESSAWLRFHAASEVDPRQTAIATPLAGDGSVAFGVPPGGRHEQDLDRGGSVFVQRRLGLVLSVRAGPNPATPEARNPALATAYGVRLPPPGPYVLRFTGQPGAIEVERLGPDGQPMPEARLRVLPQASIIW